jgi:hypothetical protein
MILSDSMVMIWVRKSRKPTGSRKSRTFAILFQKSRTFAIPLALADEIGAAVFKRQGGLKGLGSVENNTLGQVLPHQSTTQITIAMVKLTNTSAIESAPAFFAFISLVESVKESKKNIICVEKSSKIHLFFKSTATA